ncbi:hypothetical protein RY963_001748 [Stenotrophomonas maltophilia]|uniref:hypothetical protein n=1 Tax=Stenotrophomonas TaxID=40323 RepID=UPI0015DE79A1|nr:MULTISPECIES: hypothetical protein [Stenotrophomonas]ELN2584888.1 hypothetical protein [Stenotrophomonas maltophilia]ELN2592903.1 hypothetical protein [Stenotrophomonas maltophilia]MBH1400398.1 hypothetical protein [Stenotrophomonas maltophilia]MBH1703074.1 hypothetical protein [Stenotrophomonas maltophilia]MCI1113038.1 hypothetical protein [Stenotrophomonas maltophilia]
MPDLDVNVVFCDDVRREADGRVSIMGVFEGLRILPSSVDTLPKTTILALVSATPGVDLSEIDLRVSVYRSGQLEHEESYPALPNQAEADSRLTSAAEDLGLTFPVKAYYAGLVELQNFPVHDGCSIQVRAMKGEQVLSEHGVVFIQDADAVSEIQQSAVVQSKSKSKRVRRKPRS